MGAQRMLSYEDDVPQYGAPGQYGSSLQYGAPSHHGMEHTGPPVHEEPKVEYIEVPVGPLAPKQIKKLRMPELKAMLNERGVDTDEMRKADLVDKLIEKFKIEGKLLDDNTPIHGEKIEVQWEG